MTRTDWPPPGYTYDDNRGWIPPQPQPPCCNHVCDYVWQVPVWECTTVSGKRIWPHRTWSGKGLIGRLLRKRKGD